MLRRGGGVGDWARKRLHRWRARLSAVFVVCCTRGGGFGAHLDWARAPRTPSAQRVDPLPLEIGRWGTFGFNLRATRERASGPRLWFLAAPCLLVAYRLLGVARREVSVRPVDAPFRPRRLDLPRSHERFTLDPAICIARPAAHEAANALKKALTIRRTSSTDALR